MSLSINVFFSSFFIDLIHCTNSDHISIPNLAEILFERCANSNWTVVFKALITFHHLMSYGSEVRISLYKLFLLPKPFSDREACLGCGNCGTRALLVFGVFPGCSVLLLFAVFTNHLAPTGTVRNVSQPPVWQQIFMSTGQLSIAICNLSCYPVQLQLFKLEENLRRWWHSSIYQFMNFVFKPL